MNNVLNVLNIIMYCILTLIMYWRVLNVIMQYCIQCLNNVLVIRRIKSAAIRKAKTMWFVRCSNESQFLETPDLWVPFLSSSSFSPFSLLWWFWMGKNLRYYNMFTAVLGSSHLPPRLLIDTDTDRFKFHCRTWNRIFRPLEMQY